MPVKLAVPYLKHSQAEVKNSLDHAAEAYYESNAFAALKPRTQLDYRGECSKRPLIAFAGWDILHIKPSDIGNYMELRGKKSLRRANLELGWINNVLACAVRRGFIDTNPALEIKPLRMTPEQRKAKKKQYVSDYNYRCMYAKALPAQRVAMEIAYCTGIRQGDVIKLKWEDINEAMYVEEGKTDREYFKLLSPRLKAALEAARKLPGHPFSGYVVRNKYGRKYSSSGFRASWKKAKAKLPKHRWFTFHDLRHKAITDAEQGKKQ